jgi:tRNA(fMet)-specific endonuclease VapC
MTRPGAEPPGEDRAEPIVLDTSAYSYLRSGHPDVLSLLARSPLIYLPVVVIGELEAAFRQGTKLAENQAMLADFLDEPFVRVVEVTRATARTYGELVAQLRRAGTPIPTNDAWIAAIASTLDGYLLTFDRDFERVAGLRCRVLA